jgi:hypothetical protein
MDNVTRVYLKFLSIAFTGGCIALIIVSILALTKQYECKRNEIWGFILVQTIQTPLHLAIRNTIPSVMVIWGVVQFSTASWGLFTLAGAPTCTPNFIMVVTSLHIGIAYFISMVYCLMGINIE